MPITVLFSVELKACADGKIQLRSAALNSHNKIIACGTDKCGNRGVNIRVSRFGRILTVDCNDDVTVFQSGPFLRDCFL